MKKTIPISSHEASQPASFTAGKSSEAGFQDNRPEASVLQRQIQTIQQRPSPSETSDSENTEALPDAVSPGGLPLQLKTGIETLSGFSMDDVKVHYNSSKPAQLQALAYAQGTDIHVASGQEKHLPHEAWHVVQQKQGRVRPTLHLKSQTPVNDDAGLEAEADRMGAMALQLMPENNVRQSRRNYASVSGNVHQLVAPGGIEHIRNSCYIAAIINAIVSSNGLRNLINPRTHPQQQNSPAANLQNLLFRAVNSVDTTQLVSADWVRGIMTAMEQAGVIQDTAAQDVNLVLYGLMRVLHPMMMGQDGDQANAGYAGIFEWWGNNTIPEVLESAEGEQNEQAPFDPTNPATIIQIRAAIVNQTEAPMSFQLNLPDNIGVTYHLRSAIHRDVGSYEQAHYVSYMNRAQPNAQAEWHESDDLGARVRPVPNNNLRSVPVNPALLDDMQNDLTKLGVDKDKVKEHKSYRQLANRPNTNVLNQGVMLIYEREGINLDAGPDGGLQTAQNDLAHPLNGNHFMEEYLRMLCRHSQELSWRQKSSLLEMLKNRKGFEDEKKKLGGEIQTQSQSGISDVLSNLFFEPVMHGAHVEQRRVGFEGAATVLGLVVNGQVVPMQVPSASADSDKKGMKDNTEAKPIALSDLKTEDLNKKVKEYQELAMKADTKKNSLRNRVNTDEIAVDSSQLNALFNIDPDVQNARKANPIDQFRQVLLSNQSGRSRPDENNEEDKYPNEASILKRQRILAGHYFGTDSDVHEFSKLKAHLTEDATMGHSEQLLLTTQLWQSVVNRLIQTYRQALHADFSSAKIEKSGGDNKMEEDEKESTASVKRSVAIPRVPVQEVTLLLNRSPCADCAEYLSLELIHFWTRLAEGMDMAMDWDTARLVFSDAFHFRIVYTSAYEPNKNASEPVLILPDVIAALQRVGWDLISVAPLDSTGRLGGADKGSIKVEQVDETMLQKLMEIQEQQDAADEFIPDKDIDINDLPADSIALTRPRRQITGQKRKSYAEEQEQENESDVGVENNSDDQQSSPPRKRVKLTRAPARPRGRVRGDSAAPQNQPPPLTRGRPRGRPRGGRNTRGRGRGRGNNPVPDSDSD